MASATPYPIAQIEEPHRRPPSGMTHFAGLDEKKALHSRDTHADTFIKSALAPCAGVVFYEKESHHARRS